MPPSDLAGATVAQSFSRERGTHANQYLPATKPGRRYEEREASAASWSNRSDFQIRCSNTNLFLSEAFEFVCGTFVERQNLPLGEKADSLDKPMIVGHPAPHIGIAIDQRQLTATLFLDSHGRRRDELPGFCQTLIQLLRGVGIRVRQDRNVVCIEDDRADSRSASSRA